MSLTLNVGPNNLLPSSVNGLLATPTTAKWFEGALTVKFSCDAPVAVLLDFASDEYFMFTTVNGTANNYVALGYVEAGYVQADFSNLQTEYVDPEYVSPDYVVE